DMQERSERPRDRKEVHQVDEVEHHAAKRGESGQRSTDILEGGAKLPGIELERSMGAAEHASVNLGVIVRVVDGHDFEVGVLQQVIERNAALLDICVLERRWRRVANSRREVSAGVFG